MYQLPVQAPTFASHRQILHATNPQLNILLFIDIFRWPHAGYSLDTKMTRKDITKVIHIVTYTNRLFTYFISIQKLSDKVHLSTQSTYIIWIALTEWRAQPQTFKLFEFSAVFAFSASLLLQFKTLSKLELKPNLTAIIKIPKICIFCIEFVC